MSNSLINIKFKKESQNPTLDAEESLYELPFYKDTEYFTNIDNFIPFIHAVEKMVRTSNEYKKYIHYLMHDIGLNSCQVLSNIRSEESDDKKDKITIEMHHGPILTLFDYSCILVDYLLMNGEKINTFIVSDLLLEEHQNNIIQVVMLSKTVHQEVHDNNIFLNMKHAFGDLSKFLKKYGKALNDEQINKMNRYIETSKKYDSFDKHVLDISEAMKKIN